MAAVSVSSLACAQWYGGASLGTSHTPLYAADVPVSGAITAHTYPKNENDTGYKLQLGYQFSPYFALEGGYVNLGKAHITNDITATFKGSLRGDVRSEGWNLMAVGILPVTEDFSLLGKMGALFSSVRSDYTTTGAVFLAPGVASSYSKNEVNGAYGLGLQYNLNKSLAVRAEAESFVDLRASDKSKKRDVSLYSIGLIFKF